MYERMYTKLKLRCCNALTAPEKDKNGENYKMYVWYRFDFDFDFDFSASVHRSIDAY